MSMEVGNKELIDIYNLPLWSAPFGIELLRHINYKSNQKILDIGFGNGFPIMELAQRFGVTSTLYGIDIDIESIKNLKEKLSRQKIINVIIQHSTAESLPFDDGFFDLIVSNNGINNVNDKKAAIRECSRVCKIGGEFIFTFNLNSTFSEFYAIFKNVVKEFQLFEQIELIDLHINEKRPALEIIDRYLALFSFEVLEICRHEFELSFTDGTTFFNHYLIRNWFLPEWGKIIPLNFRQKVLEKIEYELNKKSDQSYLSFKVPFVCIKCRKN